MQRIPLVLVLLLGAVVAGGSARDEYAARAAAVKADDAIAQYRLALWCAEQGLDAEARFHYRAVVTIDPDHRAARRFQRAQRLPSRGDQQASGHGEMQPADAVVAAQLAFGRRIDAALVHPVDEHAVRHRVFELQVDVRVRRQQRRLRLLGQRQLCDELRTADIAQVQVQPVPVIAGGMTQRMRIARCRIERMGASIAVEPGSFDTALEEDSQVTETLSISNNGDADLTWDIEEDDGATRPLGRSCSSACRSSLRRSGW